MKSEKESTIHHNEVRIITIVIAAVLAIAGMHHGVFEILQGNTATNSLVIQAISPEYQRWQNGEEALSLIPNFLFTGIAAVLVSAVIILWGILFMHKKFGVLVLFLLFILLTLVGGGIGHILFFGITCTYASRMRKPLRLWRKVLNNSLGSVLSRLWSPGLLITVACFLIALEISVFGIPGITDHDTILTTCWLFLLAALIFINITYISGFAAVIRRTEENRATSG